MGRFFDPLNTLTIIDKKSYLWYNVKDTIPLKRVSERGCYYEWKNVLHDSG